MLSALLCAALFAGCSNPSGSSGGKETPAPDTGEISIGIGAGGNLELTGAGETSVIYKDREPSRLVLSLAGEGWTGLAWSVDGLPRGAGASVTIRAADFSEARHTVALAALRDGVPYAATIPVTVTRERPGVTWTQTADDSSLTVFDLGAWTGENCPTETWALSVVEQGAAYFAVRKPPAALITVDGPDAAWVSKAAPGETVDGSFADGLLDLFTVSFDRDAAFGEGERSFTLAVSEPGKQPKTVNVTVNMRPNLTGVAVFHRTADGSLARISVQNAADHANALYAQHKAGGFPTTPTDWGIDFVHVQNLSTALKWLDSYAQSGTSEDDMAEYLVRVEADEAMPKTQITCRMNTHTTPLAKYVKIRIRGYGGERKITHDPTNIDPATVIKEGGSVMRAFESFLSIGAEVGSTSLYEKNYLAVHLENNVTIDAASGTDPNFPTMSNAVPQIISMVAVGWGNTLVMEAGSKLTNYTVLTPISVFAYYQTAVDIEPGGFFEWRGGEISNILGYDNIIFCNDGDGTGMPAGRFTYYSGVFSGNTADVIAVGSLNNPALYDVTDPQFAPAP
jgi:hypothetical protein